MNSRPNDQLDLLLNSATEALRAATPHDGPPPELASSTIDRIHAFENESTPSTHSPAPVRLAERRELMFRIARYSTAMAATILIAVFGWLLFVDRSGPAFAGVIESVKKAESVTLLNKQKLGSQPTFEMKWYFQGDKIRMEFPGIMAIVSDLAQPTYLELDMIRKIARARPLHKEVAGLFANPVRQIQNAKPGDAKLVGEEQLDGRTVQLYRMEEVDFLGAKGEGEMRVWVDPKTNLPVKIVVDEPQKERDRRTTLEFIDFEWNKKLDEKLFRIPEDFTFKGLEEPRKEAEPTEERSSSGPGGPL
jgi:hypothetical protein